MRAHPFPNAPLTGQFGYPGKFGIRDCQWRDELEQLISQGEGTLRRNQTVQGDENMFGQERWPYRSATEKRAPRVL